MGFPKPVQALASEQHPQASSGHLQHNVNTKVEQRPLVLRLCAPWRGNYLTIGARLPTLKDMATLPSNISSLSAAEKFDLLDALWEDIEAHSSTLSAEQTEELDRRIAAYEKNPPSGTPWEQVKAGLPRR